MALAISEERKAFYLKMTSDYEEFLTREHESEFYTRIINFPNGSKRTNAEHISWLINYANEKLLKGME